jgi:hypothetical protein
MADRVSISTPQQSTRQFAGPLDKDSVFTTTAARTAYLTSPRRYAGQIWFNTTTSVTTLWANIGGTFKKITLT